MGVRTLFTLALLCAGRAFAQEYPVLVNMSTVSALEYQTGKGWGDISFRAFGGDDKLVYTNLWAGYGVAKSFDVDVRADLASFGTFSGPAGPVRFGGSDVELLGRWQTTHLGPVIQFGAADVNTPAQEHRIAGVVSAQESFGISGESLCLEPKAVFLRDNSLVGLGIGANVKLASHIHLLADWTPMLAGDNYIDPDTGSRSRVQLVGAGLRFTDLSPGLLVDVGITNATGITTGTSMTPSTGDTLGFYIGAGFRF